MSTEGMTSEAAVLFMRGVYIMNGGDPERFDELTYEDITQMYVAYMATEARQARIAAENNAAIMGRTLEESF